MNSVTINFSGTIEQLKTVLKDPPFAGREFEAVITLTLDDTPRMVEILKGCSGGIAAIKEYRARTGATLKDASEFVKRHLSGHWPDRELL